MPEWSGAPKASKPARLSSRLITASWAKLPPAPPYSSRSEEHTSELQSHHDLVCRLLLEKKKYRQVTNFVHSKDPACHISTVHRTGASYQFIAPSLDTMTPHSVSTLANAAHNALCSVHV